MLDAGDAAYKAAKAKDVAGIAALSDQLMESCTSCHKNYRPGYGRPKPPPRE
jgi:cytochrome c556